MPSLADIPVEVLLDNLLPLTPTPAVLALGSTNKFFANLTNDDTFWKHRLQSDFNFDPTVTARSSGWKFIYRRLKRPKTFVWGEATAGRLGVERVPREKHYLGGVPAPMEIKIPGKQIVSLVPGGMSFHALDSEGDLYVWGTLDGSRVALNSDGFSDPGKRADTPHKVLLPAPIRSITTGRLHAAALTSTLNVYTFRSWGRPYRLVSDLLSVNPRSPEAPAQVECGWSFSAVLTRGGRVLVWWPFGGNAREVYEQQTEAMDAQVRDGQTELRAPAENQEIHCHLWDMQIDPVLLPEIPSNLPNLSTGESEEERQKDPETRLIRIAGADNVLIGLTNRGHVLKYGELFDEATTRQSGWQYLAEWSDVKLLQRHPAYDPESNPGKEIPKAPEALRITHISAHYNTFVAYSTGKSSVVLMNYYDDLTAVRPQIIPSLQNRDVISVVLGDYFKAALMASGKLLTWGSFSRGALGLGHPKDLPLNAPGGLQTQRQLAAAQEGGPSATPVNVEEPTEVRFDWGSKRPKGRFCFLAAAAGWHMGALVIDLEPDDEDSDNESSVKMPGAFVELEGGRPHRGPLQAPPVIPRGPFEGPPIVPRGGVPWRIGLAGAPRLGRGRGRGGPGGAGGQPPNVQHEGGQ